MGKFILIEVIEQDISEPVFFDTLEEATREMHGRLKKTMSFNDDDMAAAVPMEESSCLMCIDDTAFFTDMRARCEKMGENYDWQIFEV